MQDLAQNCEMSRYRNIPLSKNADKSIKRKTNKFHDFDCNDELVFHRKSERRRMARDIFLVFEEEPQTRRSRGQGKKASRLTKSKFGHLKVNSYNKSKKVLCTVQNELSCFINGKCSSAKLSSFNSNNSKVHNISSNVQRAKVNPIFLWVKKEDTRIVEVRCEDYDKRNRIKITKTTSGWRATPCTDPSSSKTVKYLPKPLLKMKREHVQLPKIFDNSKPFVSHEKKNIREKSDVYTTFTNLFEVQVNKYNKIDIGTTKEDTNSNTNCDEYKGKLNSVSNVNETYAISSPKLELCAKTGLFISKNKLLCNDNLNQKSIYELEPFNNQINSMTKGQLLKDLDAETENLKNLLDDSDLLQNCSVNVTNSSDLIDSIVKDSCENHLLVDDQMVAEIKKYNEIDRVLSLRNINDLTYNSPKCLLFNEAGEIEGVNEELFNTNNYMNSLVKPLKNPTKLSSLTVQIAPKSQEIPIGDKSSYDETLQDLPKDLSYRKSEVISTGLRSLNECAVTSTSEVTKSPCHHLNSVFDRTIKNSLLDQVSKVTTLSSVPNQQMEPINLGKNRQASKVDYLDNILNNYVNTEEPITKRVRGSSTMGNSKNLKINNDPDPLTQLRLLLRNTELKVPDPILVPKDRLGAVLASPAREIPLLLTTRPELKLPEVFDFPNILKDPNILVISIAQLEEILLNEMQRKTLIEHRNENASFEALNVSNQDKFQNNNNKDQMDLNTKWFSFPSNLPKDVPSFAVMNKLFWLPFFGHLSQDLLNSVKNHSLTESNLKKNTLLSLIHQPFDVETIKNMYKNHSKKVASFAKKIINQENSLEIVKNSESKFTSPIEFAILNKLAESKIHHLLSSDQVQHHKREYCNNLSVSNDEVNGVNGVKAMTHIGETVIENNSVTNVLPSNNVHCSMHIPKFDNINNEFELKNSAIYKGTTKLRRVEEIKPRLTCKSLSNLLNPNNGEHGVNPLQCFENEYKNKYKTFPSEHIFQSLNSSCVISSEKSLTTNYKYIDSSSTNELVKHRKRSFNGFEKDTEEINFNVGNTLSNTNPELWPPLFRSNIPQGYSSPWQWTTVTASGE